MPKFASSYSFVYSARPGTPASIQKDFNSVEEKRLNYLQEILNNHQNNFNKMFLGQEVEILQQIMAKKKINTLEEHLIFNLFMFFHLRILL